MSKIFISHAAADHNLAKLVVDFLKEAIGVPTGAIFCSSLKGHGIPFGEDFNDYMKEQIQNPDLVILLMTPAYVESHFCLMELGAAWAQSARSLPIVVPPIEFQAVTKTLGLKQAWLINDKKGLIELKSLVLKAVKDIEERTEHTWDDKRTQWSVDLRKILPKIQQATKVDAQKHKQVVSDLKDKEAEIDRLEAALAKAQEHNAELEKLKDKEAVKSLKKGASGSKVLQKEFDALIEAVDEAKPKTSTLVLKHIIADHFDRAGRIDWFNNSPEFDAAVAYGLISREDDRVEWGRDKLKPFQNAIREVQWFLDSDDGRKLRKLQDANVPMDPDDLAFWEYHLSM
ncbi:MAG: TIR domain-containing protein [Enhydrobacter sp.]|nr:MAG: TIR domain-containing protein [Enhydrobacter sp.]